MKTFAKKSFSVVLAMLMAISTLTIGAFSAFAATKTAYYRVNEGTTQLNAANVFFTPQTSGYYNINVSSIVNGQYQYTSYRVFTKDEFDTVKENCFNAYSEEGTFAYQNPEFNENTYLDDKDELIYVDIYSPAQKTAKLLAGESYYIAVNENVVKAGAYSTITISKSEFMYEYSPIDTELEYTSWYSFNNATGSHTPIKSTRNIDNGFGISVTGYCGNSTVVNIPASISGCPVKSVNLSGFNYDDEDYYTTTTGTATALARRITSVTIPEGVETITDGAFKDFYSLSSVNLPSTLEYIGTMAFMDTAISGRVYIPAKVETIGYGAFYNTDITSAEFYSNNISIGYQAFGYKDILNDATADPTDTTYGKVNGFFVVAPVASLATVYAANNGFVAYDRANCNVGNHPYIVETVAATLFAKGSKTSTCPVCGASTKKSIAKKTFKIKSLKSSKKGTIVVKAAKQSGITGYQVQYSTSKKFTKKTTKTVTVKTTKALNKTIKGLKGGKKYYVRVRAYNKASGKTSYSKYTATKSVKVKK